MPNVVDLACTLCGTVYPPEPDRLVCDACGDVGTLDVRYDLDRVAAETDRHALVGDDMWRYRPLLPVDPDDVAPRLRVGGTPLYPAPGLAAAGGVAQVWVKDEGIEPTASLKDRASAMVVAKAMGFGRRVVATASTGNAAAALAGMCAASDGVAARILVPAAAPEAKIAQLLAYGARVYLIDGDYDAAFDLCRAAAARFGWYDRSTGVNPYTSEGKKTAALEIVEQLGWTAPDAMFVSVGDGSIVGGLHKGLADALALGWIDRMPRLYGVQSAGSDYLVQAFERNEDVTTKPPIEARTLADSIAANLPKDRVKAMRAIRESRGAFLRVDDTAILAAVPVLAAATGVFAEPAAAAAYAGFVEAAREGLVGPRERVVVVSTGSGLKDSRAAMRATAAAGIAPTRLPPDLDALADAERGAR